jgi:hypothetical protein
MNWLEVCEHPALQDLPFKIELDETGKIIMAPTKVYRNCQRIPPSATELPWFGRVKGVSVEKESDERGPRADRPHAPDSRRGRESGRS